MAAGALAVSHSSIVFLSSSVIGQPSGGIDGRRVPSMRMRARSYFGILALLTLTTWKSATCVSDIGAPFAGTSPWQA